MQFSIVGDRDPFLHVTLSRGEMVYAESDAMVTMDSTLELRGKMQGGVLSALARKFVNDESFFNQYIEAAHGSGEALLAPLLPGDIQILDVGEKQYRLNDGAFLAAQDSVQMTVKAQGLGKALFGGTGGLFLMETSGSGQLAIAGFGSIFALNVEPGSDVLIDNFHVVAWDRQLQYSIGVSTKRGGLVGNLINSLISGEGVLTRFSGSGKVYVCSRNLSGFTGYLSSKLTPRG